MKTILRVFAYVRRYPSWAVGTLLCAVMTTMMVVVFPKVAQVVIDDVRAGARRPPLDLLGYAVGAFFLRDAFNALRIILNNTFEQKVIFDLRSDLYAHIQQIPLRWFDNRATGDIMTRVLEDVTAVERVLIDGIEQGVIARPADRGRARRCSFATAVADVAGAACRVPLLAAGALAYTLTAPSALPAPAQGILGDELAAARQSRGHPADQNLRAGDARSTRASTRRATTCATRR